MLTLEKQAFENNVLKQVAIQMDILLEKQKARV